MDFGRVDVWITRGGGNRRHRAKESEFADFIVKPTFRVIVTFVYVREEGATFMPDVADALFSFKPLTLSVEGGKAIP